MDANLFQRTELARADAQRLRRRSQELQERHRAWLRRTLRTDDGLVLEIAKNREDVAKSAAAREVAGETG